MIALGFEKNVGRHYTHPHTELFVEFPGSAAMVGDEPLTEFQHLKTKAGVLKMLTPTDCVKDRLAAFYHWSDMQALDQAVWVAEAQPINLSSIEAWSQREGKSKEFQIFMDHLKKIKRDG